MPRGGAPRKIFTSDVSTVLIVLSSTVFQVVFGGAYKFWASLAKGMGRWEVATACQKLPGEVPQGRHEHQSSP